MAEARPKRNEQSENKILLAVCCVRGTLLVRKDEIINNMANPQERIAIIAGCKSEIYQLENRVNRRLNRGLLCQAEAIVYLRVLNNLFELASSQLLQTHSTYRSRQELSELYARVKNLIVVNVGEAPVLIN